MFQKSWNKDPEMSAAVATRRVRRMVELESRGHGDVDNAISRLENMIGVGYWTLWHLYHRKAKTADGTVCERIRWGYLHLCERKIGAITAELATERAISPDADLEALEAAAVDLAAQIAAAKAKRIAARGGRS